MDSEGYKEADTSSRVEEAGESGWDLSSCRMVTGSSVPGYGIVEPHQMVLSDEDLSSPSSDDDSDAERFGPNELPGIAHFSPNGLFEDEHQPIIIIYFNEVQHVFVNETMVQVEELQANAWSGSLLNVVSEEMRESAPMRMHVLISSVFYGPISQFMRLLQQELGIESDVALEFESLSLRVPINMSFATTSLSLAHIFAISMAQAEDEMTAVPILTASLFVETTNFVKQYNELVQNFKSKRSLNISASPISNGQPHPLDENMSVRSTRSAASSTWSHLAVRDNASVAGTSELDGSAYEEWDTSNRRASSFRLGLHGGFMTDRFNTPTPRDPMGLFIGETDSLSVQSLDPPPITSSRSASSSKAFAHPINRPTTTPTPPPSLSRKRPRGSVAYDGPEAGDEPDATSSSIKRPKRANQASSAHSSND